jgi:hypothetical protein
MKKMIFHLPFEPDRKRNSASNLRPFWMLDSFKELGYQVEVVMGNGITRKKQITKIKKDILEGQIFDFVYSESSTMPTLLTESHHLPLFPFLDFGFFRFLKKQKIPIGLFYRDIHWRFDQYKVHPLKKWISRLFYQYDFKEYKKSLDVIFLPSIEMGKYIPEIQGIKKLRCHLAAFSHPLSRN